MLTITTNIQSLISQRSLNKSTQLLNQAIERMSTGYKLNHASDNAANYSISTNMTTKLGAYQVAEDNAAMGLDMLTTANDSLNLISDHLVRIRALAEQAANGTYGAQSLEAINSEVNARVDEIERLYSTAEYNGIKLFEGSSGSGNFMNPINTRDVSSMEQLANLDESQTYNEGTFSISTKEELVKFSDMVNSGHLGSDVEVILANDIDLSGVDWNAIGVYGNEYTGTFDGNGHVISNLTIIKPNCDYASLFGIVEDAEIKNLGLEDINIKVNSYMNSAALIGYVHGTANGAGTNISNCYATGTNSTYYSSFDTLGALVGQGNDVTTLSDCWSSVKLYYNSLNLANNAKFNNCKAYYSSDFPLDVVKQKTDGVPALSSVSESQMLSGNYLISTAEDLERLSASVAAGLVAEGCTFILANDIDMKGRDWTPISNVSGSLAKWTLEGNGHKISNLTVRGCEYGGLFGFMTVSDYQPIIKVNNLGLEDVDIEAKYAGSFGANSALQMSNCYSTGNVKGSEKSASVVCDTRGITGGWSMPIWTSCTNNGASIPFWGWYDSSSPSPALTYISPDLPYEVVMPGSKKQTPKVYSDVNISFQIGINGSKNSQIELNTAFSLNNLDLLRNIGLNSNADYLSEIDKILENTTSKQTEYGAAQNRLESALDEISTQYENLLSSRSTLKDADIAKVSSDYIKQQILQQASATLMSTANQTPALALQLL